ncbi:MAG: dihydroxy-acid dehydratase, partial [Deltaproteobacteria bacterium]|nr:dihydroxy-acid dehydratase [Deltaproteobacteria bacterium]
DIIKINIPKRSIAVDVTDSELDQRRQVMEAKGKLAWQPLGRNRQVPKSLQAYSLMVTSAAKGAVRDLEQLR